MRHVHIITTLFLTMTFIISCNNEPNKNSSTKIMPTPSSKGISSNQVGGTMNQTCYTCGGTGQTSTPGAMGDGIDYLPCATCSGTGKLSVPVNINNPKVTEPKNIPGDPVAGRWVGPGYVLDFVRSKNGYTYIETAQLGQTATGTARLNGNQLTLDGIHVQMGKYSINLQLSGNTITGPNFVLQRQR